MLNISHSVICFLLFDTNRKFGLYFTEGFFLKILLVQNYSDTLLANIFQIYFVLYSLNISLQLFFLSPYRQTFFYMKLDTSIDYCAIESKSIFIFILILYL